MDTTETNSSTPEEKVTMQPEKAGAGIGQPDNLDTDENRFIFSADHTGDTSFVLVLEKEPLAIKATYYELLPYRESNDHAGSSSQLLSFETFNFTIDALKWKSIIQKSAPLLETGYSIRYTEQREGSRFSVAHNSKLKLCNDLSNVNQLAAFQELERHIKKVLWRDFFQRKLTTNAFAVK
jgi:hypothetical protein